MSADTPPSAKRRKLNFREEVVVFVGSEKNKFTVHKESLIKSSDFFKTCLNGAWKESKTKTLTLPETDADTFSVYLQRLYADEVVIADDQDECVPTDYEEKCKRTERYFRTLVSLAIFADSYNDIAFQNAVNDLWIDTAAKFNMNASTWCLARLHSSLPPQSKTLAFVADDFASCIDPETLAGDISEYPPQFLQQVWIAMSRAQKSDQGAVLVPTFERRCAYHEHNNKVPKTAKRTE